MITIPANISCDHRKIGDQCAATCVMAMKVAKLTGFYADGASMEQAIDIDEVRLPEGWIALHYRWQDCGQIELRTYCPAHADEHKNEGRPL